MRVLASALAVLIVLLQYPLWLGKGSWLRVWELDRRLQSQKEENAKLAGRNSALEAEVRDLKQGFDAIEERALRAGDDQAGRGVLPGCAFAAADGAGTKELKGGYLNSMNIAEVQALASSA